MCESLRGWWRESFEDAVDFPVELANVSPNLADCRLAIGELLLHGSKATAETQGCAAHGQEHRRSNGDYGNDDGCGVRGGSPCRVATFRLCGSPTRRWRP